MDGHPASQPANQPIGWLSTYPPIDFIMAREIADKETLDFIMLGESVDKETIYFILLRETVYKETMLFIMLGEAVDAVHAPTHGGGGWLAGWPSTYPNTVVVAGWLAGRPPNIPRWWLVDDQPAS